MIERIKQTPRSVLIFSIIGIVIVVLGLLGIFQSKNDVDISAEQAIEIASAELDFTPTNTETRILRQGFALDPVWAVLFIIRDPEGTNSDFLRQLTVEVDGQTGEILRVGDDGKEGDPNAGN